MATEQYIKRSDVLKAVRNAKGYTEHGEVLAHWESFSEPYFVGIEEIVSCSKCSVGLIQTKSGMQIPMVRSFGYCPNCGAKMVKGDNG